MYGVAQAAGGSYLWAGSSCRLYRAPLDEPLLDLSHDVTALKMVSGRQSSHLRVELDNSSYSYSGSAPELEPGSLMLLSLGYVTPHGTETGPVFQFEIKSREIYAGRGRCRLVVEAGGGWERLALWQARHQYRWNRTPGETAVVQILAFLLARAGMTLESANASTAAHALAPDFTLNPGSQGDQAVIRLIKMLPDRLVFEGMKGCLYNPQDTGEACYAYSFCTGFGYPVYESAWKKTLPVFNHIQVEGEDPATGELVLGTALDRDSILESGERLLVESGQTAGSPEEASSRAHVLLDGLLLSASGGYLITPLNPAAQVGDVVEVDSPALEMSGNRCRIAAMETVYEPRRGRYEQIIELEPVTG